MINEKEKETIIRIFKEHILSPVVYMLDAFDAVQLICFLDGNVTLEELYDTEAELKRAVGVSFEVVDIRQFSESDRIGVLEAATVLYAESNAIKTLFERSVAEDYLIMMKEKEDTITRYSETSSPYLH